MAGNRNDADKDILAGEGPPSARVALSRERIIEAAVEFIDHEGLPGLTMRKLGQRLDVEAMSLYRYVDGREELLDGVVSYVVDLMKHDEEVLEAPRDGWQDYLQRLAHGVRRIALAHPKVFPLVASRPAEAPWLRPPLRSIEWVEMFLDGLAHEGFDDDSAVGAYRAFTSFLLGHLLLEVAAQGADLGPLDVVEEETEPEIDALAPFPSVRRLKPALSEDHSAVEFEEALEELLNRIALMLSNKIS